MSMRAMLLEKPHSPLVLTTLPIPTPSEHEIQIQVLCCGICRTDLHILDGELPHPTLPLVMGHQIVGVVSGCGENVSEYSVGDRVGVPWLGQSCGQCDYCRCHQENLCDNAQYTGYQRNGGLAEYCVADARFCFPLPKGYDPLQAAPLFCAGLIGFRAMNKIKHAKRIGFYGFGASAHILTQLAHFQGKEVYAFTRPGDAKTQEFALSLGACWAGGSDEDPPVALDAAIIFAPDGSLIPTTLKKLKKGGTVVCAGIHMSDIPSFPYDILWGERQVCSVANLTREDGREFLSLAPQVPIQTNVSVYPLEKANEALTALREGLFCGAAVIAIKDELLR